MVNTYPAQTEPGSKKIHTATEDTPETKRSQQMVLQEKNKSLQTPQDQSSTENRNEPSSDIPTTDIDQESKNQELEQSLHKNTSETDNTQNSELNQNTSETGMTSEKKRKREDSNASPTKIRSVLLDLEGTTTSISFVTDTLFPYIRENVASFLAAHWDDEDIQADIKSLRELSEQDERNQVSGAIKIVNENVGKEEVLRSTVENVLWQMDSDRKSGPLKSLQGHMYPEAYKNGKIHGHVYPDVLPALKKWQERGVVINIYSSGSILAQKLLFQYSEQGDLTGYVKHHFDTTTGSKLESSSYEKISQSLLEDVKARTEDKESNSTVEMKNILFITDNYHEAVAANAAGLSVCVSVRPGTKELPADNQFPVVTSFDELFSTQEERIPFEF